MMTQASPPLLTVARPSGALLPQLVKAGKRSLALAPDCPLVASDSHDRIRFPNQRPRQARARTRWNLSLEVGPITHRILAFPIFLLVLFGLTVAGCGDSGPVSLDEEEDPIARFDLPLNAGGIGLIIDVRPMFRNGYSPTEAEVTFQDHSTRDTILEIDQRTNVAVLSIPNDSLSEDEKTAFASGVATNIAIREGNQLELANQSYDQLVLDNSNRPLTLQTDSPFVPRPVIIDDGKPYLVQQEDTFSQINKDLLQSFDSRTIGTGFYDLENPNPAQQFFFSSVSNSDAYVIGQNTGTPTHWCVMVGSSAFTPPGVDARFLELLTSCNAPADTAVLVLEQDDDGWVRLRLQSTGEYVELKDGEVLLADPDPNTFAEASRFRVISDIIAWTLVDRGTHFSQPILPPAQLDFAYQGNLINCSAATLTETVGQTKTRTRTTTFGTSESLELFSSTSIKVGMKIATAVEASPTGGTFDKTTLSSETSTEVEFSTSNTYTTGNTFEESSSVTEEVSRTRLVEIPPQTAIRVSDFVRTFENVVTPFTQAIRVTGRYKDDDTALSGLDISTQLLFSFFGGVVTEVGVDYVDVSIRGEAETDQFFEAETTAQDIEEACG